MEKATKSGRNSVMNLFQFLNMVHAENMNSTFFTEFQVLLNQAISEVKDNGNQKLLLTGLCKQLSKLFSSNSEENYVVSRFILQFLHLQGYISEIESDAVVWINSLLNRLERNSGPSTLNQLSSILLLFKGNPTLQKQLNSTWVPKLYACMGKYLSIHSNEIVFLINLE
jgi:hypothetical protein